MTSGGYHYHAYSTRARQGDTGRKVRAIPMNKPDRIVVGDIEERLLDPEWIEDMLASLLDHRQEKHMGAAPERYAAYKR